MRFSHHTKYFHHSKFNHYCNHECICTIFYIVQFHIVENCWENMMMLLNVKLQNSWTQFFLFVRWILYVNVHLLTFDCHPVVKPPNRKCRHSIKSLFQTRQKVWMRWKQMWRQLFVSELGWHIRNFSNIAPWSSRILLLGELFSGTNWKFNYAAMIALNHS